MELAELEETCTVCCFNRFVAELEVNLSRGFVVKLVKTELFLATFVSIEQLLNEAEFFTCIVLLTLSGTVHAELNEDDRCTGMLDASFSIRVRSFARCCWLPSVPFDGDAVTSASFLPISVTVDECCFFEELFDTSDDEEE